MHIFEANLIYDYFLEIQLNVYNVDVFEL